ncbi:MAG: hypothetical protein ACREQY_20580, partial [Candidatus Binatia bacterium]
TQRRTSPLTRDAAPRYSFSRDFNAFRPEALMNSSTRKRLLSMCIVVVVAVVSGCTTMRRRPISGQDIDPDQVRQIVPQETTKAQIEEWFGPAEKVVRNADGTEEYRYSYLGYVDRKVEALVYMRKETNKENKYLQLALRDGLVQRVNYTNSLDPDENVKMPETGE